MSYRIDREKKQKENKLSKDAENNTVVPTAESNNTK